MSIAVLAIALSAATAEAPGSGTPKPNDKVICRRMPVAGSLIRQSRVCHTSSEWQRIRSEARSDLEALTVPGPRPTM